LSAATLGPTLDGVSTLTVTIAGTSLTVSVDASGHFELSGVPPGNIELLFRDGSSTWTVVIVVCQEIGEFSARASNSPRSLSVRQ